ncbi:hypothetical protein KY363_01280 [Candidatus Woesearchaeota archaeon]|nr:hypothetical protein [Candidatus Woesearchaeota archaeon]
MKKTALTVLIISFLILAAGIASAASSKLEIDRVEIVSDGRVLISTSSSTGSIKVDPGDSLSIEIDLENLYPRSSDNEIRDIRVTAYIDDIDDGDTIDDSDETDVYSGRDRTVKLRLKIPEDASSYKNYDLVIEAEGEDENRTVHSDSIEIELEVNRKENELVFETLQVGDADCNGNLRVKLEIQNTGEEEEKDVELSLSTERGTAWSDTFDLESINDDIDGESRYSEAVTLDVDDLSPGSHYLKVQALYDNERKSLDRNVLFNVDDCRATVTGSTVKEDTTYRPVEQYSNPNRDTRFLFGNENTVEVQLPPPGAVTPTLPQGRTESDGLGTFVLLLANIAILIFIILLVNTLRD